MTTTTGADIDVPVRWLDGEPPQALGAGATFGVPIERGVIHDVSELRLRGDGRPVSAQFWPLARWPDGSVKWSGVAVPALERPAAHFRVTRDSDPIPEEPRVVVSATGTGFLVDTGVVEVDVRRGGEHVVESVRRGGRLVALRGALVSSCASGPDITSVREEYVGIVEDAVLEQSGPARAVIRLTGRHHSRHSQRRWLPFTVRLVAVAGSASVRLVHSFVWDGDPDTDFLSSLGLRFDVPLDDALHDRHVRIATAEGGFVREAVRGVTGLSKMPGQAVRDAQLAGRRTPPPASWDNDVGKLLRYVPSWSDWSLRQHTANGYVLRKRTGPDRPWITILQGSRAGGYAYVGCPQGGLAIGLTGFWQSHPTGIDITGADQRFATTTVWMWSPESEPMDLRFYHDGLGKDTFQRQLEGLSITYEDYEPGLGTAHGISRTHELQITAHATTPDIPALVSDAASVLSAPRLVPTPAALHDAGVFGDWDLVDRRTPARAALEDRLESLIDFYLAEVDQRSWYGFWDYGDVMHSYDIDRHTWRYDVGGFAWDNSELATDLWLWTTFMRTGRADVFRMAEAMARHTGDVDAYHVGPFAGLGTRHNVQHWGCGCKQLRIGSAAFRRAHYFLTADEHSRDLLISLRDADRAYVQLDPTRKSRDESLKDAIDPRSVRSSFGLDWSSLAAAWLADWEITGDERSRDRLLASMATIADSELGFFHGDVRYDVTTGRFAADGGPPSVSHLSAIFGLVELCSELIDLVDVPGFDAAWLRYCTLYGAGPEEQARELGAELVPAAFPQWHSRLLAYASARLGRPDLADGAWQGFFKGGQYTPVVLPSARLVEPPLVPHPVRELFPLSTNDAAQSSLATIQNLALIGDALTRNHPMEITLRRQDDVSENDGVR